MEIHTPLVTELTSAALIALVAMLAPLLAALTRKRIPDVVWMLGLGIVIGPSVLGVATNTAGIHFVRELGLGVLFLLAGLEVNPDHMRDSYGRRTIRTWVLCLAISIGLSLLITHQSAKVAIALGIATTSTALGALLPILKDSGQLSTPLGSATMRHGAIGELGPILAMTLLLSARGAWQSMLVLISFAVLTVLIVAIPHRVFGGHTGLQKTMKAGVNTTAQTSLRLAVLGLLVLMLLSAIFDLDIVLGAFVAGVIARQMMPDEEALEVFTSKVQIVGFSFLIPVFFVTSGMNINIKAVFANGWMLVGLVFIIFLVRGLPVFLRELGPATWRFWRKDLNDQERTAGLDTWQEKLALGFYAATGLPIIVAVTEVAEASGLMTDEIASVLVASGMCTVLLFPLLANLLVTRKVLPASFHKKKQKIME